MTFRPSFLSRSGFSILTLLLALTMSVRALAQDAFYDDFNRPDGDPGPNWTHLTSAEWQIIGGQVVSAVDPVEMVYNGLTLDRKPFTIEAEFWTTTSRWYGILFHADPAQTGTYWVFRISPGTSGFQLIRFVEGSAQVAINTTVPGGLTLTERYRLQVHAPEAGDVEVRLFRADDGVELLMHSHNVADGIPEGGGYAGLYANGSGVRADDFSLQFAGDPAEPVEAHLFTDDFNRPDSVDFGPDWMPSAEWMLRDAVAFRAPSSEGDLRYVGAELNQPFRIETNVSGPDFGWRGMRFHDHGDISFVFRIRGGDGAYQILRYDPETTVIRNVALPEVGKPGVFYRLAVESFGEGELYRFTIHELDENGEPVAEVLTRTEAYSFFADDEGGTSGIYTSGRVESNWFYLRIGDEPGVDLAEWLAEHFEGSPEELSHPAADPDGDGVPNALEYALDRDPWTPDVTGLPRAVTVGGGLVFEFQRRANADAAYSVQASNDLADWSDIAHLAPGASTWSGPAVVRESDANGRIAVEVDDPSGVESQSRRFLRLEVSVQGVTIPTEPVYHGELVYDDSLLLDDSSWAWNTAPWDQEKIASFNGYQYVVYWDSTQTLTLARRNLSDDSIQTLRFPGESLWTDDPHYSTALGISEGDGRLHLSYGQWMSSLQYLRSIEGFLTNPPATLDRSQFGQRESMVGSDEQMVTYPRFFNAGDGTLHFLYRFAGSGNGPSYLNRYNHSTGAWSRVGMLFSNTGNYTSPECGSSNSRNAYENDVVLDATGRLHITWVYREGFGVFYNHDLHYAYSDDGGDTWFNNDGVKIADLPAGDPIQVDDPGIVVVNIPCGSDIINTAAMVVDLEGQPHVVMLQSTTTSHTNSHKRHLWRLPDGTWETQWIGDIRVPRTGWRPRGALAIDPLDNLHYFFVEGGVLKYYTAKAEDEWDIWTGRNLSKRGGGGEGFRYDRRLWEETGKLAFPMVRGTPPAFELQMLHWFEPEQP